MDCWINQLQKSKDVRGIKLDSHKASAPKDNFGKVKVDLDPSEARKNKELRRYRLNAIQIPRLRLLGFGLLSFFIFLHNLVILEPFSWFPFFLCTIILFSYALLSWLILYLFFSKLKAIDLSLFFLNADIFIFILVIYFTGGEKSWLFFLLMVRVADQTNTNFKRVLYFSHLSVLSYFLLLSYLSLVEHRSLAWPIELSKILFIYSSNFYIALTAKTAEKLRNRTGASIRKARDELIRRKKIEDALRESEERFKDISYSMADWIWEVDKNGLYKYASGKVKQILGYDPNEIIDKTPFDLMPKKEAERVAEFFRKIASEKKPIIDLENWNLTKAGKKVCLLTNGVPILDESNELIGYRGVDKDITERKQIEVEKKKLEAQLQRAQKMEAIGALAGGVAHDLNNILSGLVGYPELLLMDLPEDSPLKKSILIIQKSGQKAAAIVQDLLTLARRGVAVEEIVSINEIINDYFKSTEHEKLQKYHPNVQCKISSETNLLNILGSPVHLFKTVMNLVSNAAEAIGDSGEIIISTRNEYIDKPITGYDHVVEGDYVVLTVADNGMGILAEDIEKIFEPFYTKKKMGRSGTGLGMAVVWGTVKDHNGYIDVQSTKGKGTTFRLYFPVTRKEVAEEKTAVSIDDYRGTETVLIVDDIQEQREIASAMLSKLGYSVATVSSGEEAVDYMRKNSPNLIVLDMIMDPGIDGLETFKRILKLNPGQKAIITSGFSETERVKEAQRLGVGAYVKKPYLLERLGLAVRTELDK
jgi:PAS domain S-box-containing protein